jgi:hypothetical protein
MKKQIKGLVILAVVWIWVMGLAIAVCSSPAPSPLHRYYDLGAGVVCWTVGDKMACLPINQSKLYGGKEATTPNEDF